MTELTGESIDRDWEIGRQVEWVDGGENWEWTMTQ